METDTLAPDPLHKVTDPLRVCFICHRETAWSLSGRHTGRKWDYGDCEGLRTFGGVLAARWIGLPVIQGRHFAIDPASIGILGFEVDHPQRRVIALWNAAAKLSP